MGLWLLVHAHVNKFRYVRRDHMVDSQLREIISSDPGRCRSVMGGGTGHRSIPLMIDREAALPDPACLEEMAFVVVVPGCRMRRAVQRPVTPVHRRYRAAAFPPSPICAMKWQHVVGWVPRRSGAIPDRWMFSSCTGTCLVSPAEPVFKIRALRNWLARAVASAGPLRHRVGPGHPLWPFESPADEPSMPDVPVLRVHRHRGGPGPATFMAMDEFGPAPSVPLIPEHATSLVVAPLFA